MMDYLIFQSVSNSTELVSVIFTILMSFLLSTSVGVTYVKTFKGLSYSRNYVQALVLSSIVAATVMHAIGDSLARGLGMIGALAIIRFRTSFKDSKDILFMFSSLAAGIGCGVGAFGVAVIGTMGFVMVAFLLYYSPMGQESYFDGMLRFNIQNNDKNKIELENLLNTYCRNFALVTLRDMKQGDRLDYAYHVKFRRNKNNSELISILPARIPSIKGVSLMLQETTVEL